MCCSKCAFPHARTKEEHAKQSTILSVHWERERKRIRESKNKMKKIYRSNAIHVYKWQIKNQNIYRLIWYYCIINTQKHKDDDELQIDENCGIKMPLVKKKQWK